MKILAKIAFLIVFSFVFGMVSCIKEPVYPIEPVLTFEDFVRYGSDSAWFVFSFTDGDGDIGIPDNDRTDTSSIYYYNFYMDYFEKQEGEFVKISPLVPFSYRIPYITPKGRRKALEGEIVVRMPFEYYDFLSPYDTIKYEAYIYDRARNKSNVISTGEMLKY